MKKILSFLIILIPLVSCKEGILDSHPPLHTDFVSSSDWDDEFSNYIKDAQKVTLNFSSIEELEKTASMLSALSEIELKKWYDNKGFISQQTLYDNAIDELQELTSKEDAERYKKKYKHFFLFNEVVEDEDLSPYLPVSKEIYSYVTNVYGRVIINGVERNLNDYKSFEETAFARYIRGAGKTRADEWNNYLYASTSNRKFWAEANRSNQEVFIQFTAHKKSWVGWGKYKTGYTFSSTKFEDNGSYKDDNKSWFFKQLLNGSYTEEMPSGRSNSLGTYTKDEIGTDTNIFDYYTIDIKIDINTFGVPNGGCLRIYYPTM